MPSKDNRLTITVKVNIKKYLSEIGRKGGQTKSRAKLAAARENGKLGGRPRKPKRVARRANAEASNSRP